MIRRYTFTAMHRVELFADSLGQAERAFETRLAGLRDTDRPVLDRSDYVLTEIFVPLD